MAGALGHKALNRLVAKVAAPFLDLIQNWRSHLSKEDHGLIAKEVETADSRFDDLWERTRGSYPNTTIRTAKILNWYCFGSKHFQKKLFAVNQRDRLLAYMILIPVSDQRFHILECIDLWGEFENETAMRVLVKAVKEYAQKNAFDLIKFPSFSRKVGNLFARLGLWQIPSRERRGFYKVNLKSAGALSEDNSYFPYTLGDFGL